MESHIESLVKRLKKNPSQEDITEAANNLESIRKTVLALHDSPKSLLSQMTQWATREIQNEDNTTEPLKQEFSIFHKKGDLVGHIPSATSPEDALAQFAVKTNSSTGFLLGTGYTAKPYKKG